MSDPLFQNFAPIQNDKQQLPVTLEAAETITPTTALTFITGQVSIANITPPSNGYCKIVLCFLDPEAPGTLIEGGAINPIKSSYVPISYYPIALHYDPSSNFWYVQIAV